MFGCDADVTTLGKIIGGGLPVGAVGGKREIMAIFDPREGFTAWHGGTFNGNPMTMSAGLASMELLTPEALRTLNELGDMARAKVREAFDAAGATGQVTGLGSLLRIHCTDRKLSDYRSFYPSADEARKLDWLMIYLLNHGFLITRMGTVTLSTVTTETEIEHFAETLHAGLETMKNNPPAVEVGVNA